MLLVVLGSLFVADFLVTAIGLIGLNRKLKNLEYVTSKLRQGSNKLGEDLFQGAVALYDKQQESKQVLLTKGLAGKRALQKDWQREAARLKVKYEENIRNNWLRRRLQNAFPDLRILKYNEQLEELRQNMDVLRRRSWEALRKRNEDARAAYETRLVPGRSGPLPLGCATPSCFGFSWWATWWALCWRRFMPWCAPMSSRCGWAWCLAPSSRCTAWGRWQHAI